MYNNFFVNPSIDGPDPSIIIPEDEDGIEAPHYDDVYDLPTYNPGDRPPCYGLVMAVGEDGNADYSDVDIMTDFFDMPNSSPRVTTIVARSLTTVNNTAFPRLGLERLDGCDCWLQDASDLSLPPTSLLSVNFGKRAKHLKPYKLLEAPGSYLLTSKFNEANLVLANEGEYWYLYTARNCHQVESVSGYMRGHNACLLRSFRIRDDHVSVLSSLPVDGLLDLETDVDEHYSSNAFRQRLEQRHPLSSQDQHPTGEVVSENSDMVWCKGVLMTREMKQAQRRQTRAIKSAARARGEKPPKTTQYQVPNRFRGLTTQEYHEAVKREADDLAEWYNASKNRRSYPQAVKEWFKSPNGSAQWMAVHNFAVSRREFALKQLKDINIYLRSLGMPVDLQLNENLINKERERRLKQEAQRNRQLDASSSRIDASTSAQRAWHNKQKCRAQEEIAAFMKTSLQGPAWAEMDDDSLPDLDW